jgi:hypothetical protein
MVPTVRWTFRIDRLNSTGSSGFTADEYQIGLTFGHTGGYGTDTHLGYQLDVDTGPGIGIF